MTNKLMHIVDQDGINDSLCQELLEDGKNASDAGVHSDDDYTAFFFAGHLADDILEDTFGMKVSPDQKKDLCKYICSHKDGEHYTLDNLTDYRLLTHKWLCDRLDKKAHPNVDVMHERQPVYDIDKWISTLKEIYATLHNKRNISRQDAITRHTLEWDDEERRKFSNWMRYYEEGTPEKYNVKNAAFKKIAYDFGAPLPEAWINREDRSNAQPQISTYQPDEHQTKREQELEQAKQLKSKMRSRLRSLRRLLERYSDILTGQDLENIMDEMYALDKSINKLNVYASIEDCVIRSANKIEKLGFPEGAKILKTAVEPAPANDIAKSIPEGMSPEPNLAPGTEAGTNVSAIISRLEGVSKRLKSRDTIRELATIDILLNDIGLASYFPELTDAQAKLIEAYGYASNKIESIIAKLRGSGTEKADKKQPVAPKMPAPQQPKAPPAPKMDTGEIMTKPVGEVKETLPPKPRG